jgi:hypothetical protein
VLADDETPARSGRASGGRRASIAPDVEPPLSNDSADDEETDEIGDEIQRILSSYNEGR